MNSQLLTDRIAPRKMFNFNVIFVLTQISQNVLVLLSLLIQSLPMNHYCKCQCFQTLINYIYAGYFGCWHLSDLKSNKFRFEAELNMTPTACIRECEHEHTFDVAILVVCFLINTSPCSLSFSCSRSRSGSSFKMNNFWTISHYVFK